MIADIELESSEAEVPQDNTVGTTDDPEVTAQELRRYLQVNTILLQTIIRDLEDIKQKLGA